MKKYLMTNLFCIGQGKQKKPRCISTSSAIFMLSEFFKKISPSYTYTVSSLCCLNGLDKVLVSFFFFFGIPKKTTSSISSDHVCNIYYYETNNFFVCLCLCKYKIELSTYGLCVFFSRVNSLYRRK